MNVDEKLRLWQFTELNPLGKKSTLVRNNSDGTLMVKCVCKEESFDIFDRISRLEHPNLMRVYDSVIQNGKCVSVCEYIEGVTLDEAVNSNRLFSEIKVKNIIAQLCDGLIELHKLGIIHRDINPSNVMIDKSGIVKIIDYDIARSVKNGQSKDTQVFGTPGYAAPEQFGFSQTDARADIYSCGVLMNFLLTGKLPNEKLYQGGLTPIIRRCIEMDSDNRYNNADDLKREILGRKFYKRNKTSKKYINYAIPPGFRGKNVFLKILTIIFITGYVVFAFAYFNYTIHFLGTMDRPVRQILTGVDFLVLLTLLPYLTLGDIGGLSRFIVKGKPQIGRRIFIAIGVCSLIAGVVLFCFLPSMPY